MVLCPGLLHGLRLCVNLCMTRHAPSLKSSLHACPKISKTFSTTRKRTKKTKCRQFFYLTSDFFNFCSPCFCYHIFTVDLNFLKLKIQKCVSTVCLHCNFVILKKITYRTTGDQCSRYKLATLVHSVWV